MPFTLTLQAESILQEGKYLRVSDVSDWSEADHPRTSFGVFLNGNFHLAAEGTEVALEEYDPLSAVFWDAESPLNGRYVFTGYAFLERDVVVPNEGDVQVHTDGILYQWVATEWVAVQLEDVLDKAYYTSEILDVPLLSHAYAYRAILNLEYVKRVKGDVERGIEQDALYYTRVTLDYFRALIKAAEYNFTLGSYQHYYEISNTLNEIIANRKAE